MKFPKDPTIEKLYLRVTTELGELPTITPLKPENYYLELCETIIGQQLSGKAANAIRAKFVKLLPRGTYDPKIILKIPHEAMRAAGLSNAKAKYIKNLSQYYLDNFKQFHKMFEMADAEVIDFLIQIKGIGQWTAEMFLLFGLARPDIFSLGDLGLKKGAIKTYNLAEDISKAELLALSQKWSPNRSLASRLLWKSLELTEPAIIVMLPLS